MELEIAKEAEKIYKDYDISLEKAIEIAKNIRGGKYEKHIRRFK